MRVTRPYELPSMRAISALGVGAAIAVFTAIALLHLVRTVLHYGCEYLVGGEAGFGSWACADGIGYIFPGLSLLLPVFLVSVVGLVLMFALRAGWARRIVLVIGAIVPLTWAFIWTLGSAQLYVGRHPDSLGVWASAILPALSIALGGALVLAAGPIRSVRSDLIVLGLGMGLFVLAAALQPGPIPMFAISAGFGVAATRPMTLPNYVLTQ